MKSKILFLAFLLFALCAQFSIAQNPFLKVVGDKIEVNITRKATKSDLLDLKRELMEKHKIQVDFTSLDFSNNGRLKGIAMSVKSPNGDSGTCQTSRVCGNRGAFFTVDNTPGAKTIFLIGAGKKK